MSSIFVLTFEQTPAKYLTLTEFIFGKFWEVGQFPLTFMLPLKLNIGLIYIFFSEIGVSLLRMNKLLLSNSNFQVFS